MKKMKNLDIKLCITMRPCLMNGRFTRVHPAKRHGQLQKEKCEYFDMAPGIQLTSSLALGSDGPCFAWASTSVVMTPP
jgi:hypothetical protein